MDSLERLGHSLEQAVALIHSLRRENRELASVAAEAKLASAAKIELVSLHALLDESKIEIERLREEPAPDIEAQERARHAEIEAAGLAQQLEQERQRRYAEKKDFELKIHDLELRTLAAEREETMPLAAPDKATELENLSLRCAELEVMLAQAQAQCEKSRGDITAMQVRLAESADPEEVSSWQERIHSLTEELEGLRHLNSMKISLDAEKIEVRKQRKMLAAISREREMTHKKLEEIYVMLDNLRLS